MKSADFVHLHNHSEYSLLDGMLKIASNRGEPSAFLKTVSSFNMPAVSITDHGNMYGAAEFYFSAREAGIKPIIGCEVYVAEKTRQEKGNRRTTGHMTLLAKDNEGYQNLMALVSEAFLTGFYHDPRVDTELLQKYNKGLIALSGCLKSHISQACLVGNVDKAAELAMKYRDIFGEGNFYIELMDHDMEEEQQAMKGLLQVSKKTGIPVVATNDCHYLNQEDWEAHDVHLCISTGDMLDDPNRLKMSTHELYFKSPEEMKKLFSHTPEAITNTVEVAQKCNVELSHDKFILPHFEIPSQNAAQGMEKYLENLCLEGLKRKVGSDIPPDYQERLKFELDVINKMKFPSYFLIVSDFIKYARENDISVGPGRGSGAGSLVSYSLDITRVDPMKNGLLFERFLNPDRLTMPDLDIDFSDTGRAQVIDYVKNKYGEKNVAQIITFGTIRARSAIKDVARVMSFTVKEANDLAKLIPQELDITIYSALKGSAELRKAQKDPRVKKLLDFAQRIEGLKRHTGIHAAGIVVTREEVMKYAPLARGSGDVITSQFEGETLVKLGLLKIDFLGLKTLSVIDKTLELVKKHRNIDIDIDNIPREDEKTYELLCQGKTMGVFQLESRGMRDLVRNLKPSQFSDISALVALYRPGPMQSGMLDEFVERKHGRKKIVYDHPLLEPILKETYGTMVYQEQVMEISKSLAGFTPGQADGLRKAMGKKIVSAMEQARTDFVQGCKKNKISEKLATKIFDQMAEFAGYGFNKSHSVAYGLLSYQTAYLKANYPVEFLTATLTSEIGRNAIGSEERENKIVTYLDEAKKMGIPTLPPDIQFSESDFSIERNKDEISAIRFGMRAIKNVGEEAVNSIVREREKGGKYTTLLDLCSKVDLRQVNKKTLESLAKAGALDSLYPNMSPEEGRALLLSEVISTAEKAGKIKEEVASGQGSLFGSEAINTFVREDDSNKKPDPLSEHELLSYEKEVLGFYFSGHPLVKYEQQLKAVSSMNIKQILDSKESVNVRVAGLINSVRKKQTKQKQAWVQFDFEDLTESIKVNVFPRQYAKIADRIKADTIVVISGKINLRSSVDFAIPEINVEEVVPLFEAINRWGKSLVLSFSPTTMEEEVLKELNKLFAKNKGRVPVYLQLNLPQKKMTLIETKEKVNLTKDFFEETEKILGDKSWLVESSF
jgi:DNA polymerase III subunit alpha